MPVRKVTSVEGREVLSGKGASMKKTSRKILHCFS